MVKKDAGESHDLAVKRAVRKGYAKVARREPQANSCCCGSEAFEVSKAIGYSEEDMQTVPEGANMGLGCGNPVALASLKPGEIVIDLGSGGGFDCFLAAKRVGSSGRVIGVDMTAEMLDKARRNASKGGYRNVEFRLGEIENLPVADNTSDVIISNCVINLSSDKPRVFREAFRVLRPGGRLMISDMVLLKDLPEKIKKSVRAYVGCLSGAMFKKDYLSAIDKAGFTKLRVIEETKFPFELMANDETAKALVKEGNITRVDVDEIADAVASLNVYAEKPYETK